MVTLKCNWGKFSSEKSDEIFSRRRIIFPDKNFPRQKFSPTKFSPIRYVDYGGTKDIPEDKYS